MARKSLRKPDADLQRWKKKALRLFKAGDSPACSFVSRAISEEEAERILEALEEAESEGGVRRAYDPNEARDEDGKWTVAAGSASLHREKTGKEYREGIKLDLGKHLGFHVTEDGYEIAVTPQGNKKIASAKASPALADAAANLTGLLKAARVV